MIHTCKLIICFWKKKEINVCFVRPTIDDNITKYLQMVIITCIGEALSRKNRCIIVDGVKIKILSYKNTQITKRLPNSLVTNFV